MSVLLLCSQRKLLPFDPHYPANLQQEAQSSGASSPAGWKSLPFQGGHICFYLQQIQRINISECLTSRDKDPLSNVPLSSSICHGSVSSCPVGRKTGACHVAERVNAPQSLSAEQTPRSAAEGREDCLRHCPPRRFTVRGFVGGGYTPSLLAQSVFQVAVRPASQPASQPSSLAASLSRLLRSEPCIL